MKWFIFIATDRSLKRVIGKNKLDCSFIFIFLGRLASASWYPFSTYEILTECTCRIKDIRKCMYVNSRFLLTVKYRTVCTVLYSAR